jgi:hypothetical protein
MTLNIDIQQNSIECHYAECRDYLNVMLSVIMVNVVMLKVVMLSVSAPQIAKAANFITLFWRLSV